MAGSIGRRALGSGCSYGVVLVAVLWSLAFSTGEAGAAETAGQQPAAASEEPATIEPSSPAPELVGGKEYCASGAGECPWYDTPTILVHGYSPQLVFEPTVNCHNYWGNEPRHLEEAARAAGGHDLPQLATIGVYASDKECSTLDESGASSTSAYLDEFRPASLEKNVPQGQGWVEQAENATPIPLLGYELRAYILNRYGQRPVNLVGHSMGGLIIRAALDDTGEYTTPDTFCRRNALNLPECQSFPVTFNFSELSTEPDVLHGVTIGTPHEGVGTAVCEQGISRENSEMCPGTQTMNWLAGVPTHGLNRTFWTALAAGGRFEFEHVAPLNFKERTEPPIGDSTVPEASAAVLPSAGGFSGTAGAFNPDIRVLYWRTQYYKHELNEASGSDEKRPSDETCEREPESWGEQASCFDAEYASGGATSLTQVSNGTFPGIRRMVVYGLMGTMPPASPPPSISGTSTGEAEALEYPNNELYWRHLKTLVLSGNHFGEFEEGPANETHVARASDYSVELRDGAEEWGPGAKPIECQGWASNAKTWHYDYSNNHTIACAMPAGLPKCSQGVVRVATGDGSSEWAPIALGENTGSPVVTGVEPALGPPSGGNRVVITGSNFCGRPVVKFGGTIAEVRSVTATRLEVVAPMEGTATLVDVTVSTEAGISATGASDHYEYKVSASAGPAYVEIFSEYGSVGGPESRIAGNAAWNETECVNVQNWLGHQTVLYNSEWANFVDGAEAWTEAVGTTTGTMWWTAGTGVLKPNTDYAVYANIDTCNASTTAATYTIAGNDGQRGFASGVTGQANVVVDQALKSGYVPLGTVNSGTGGVTVALVNAAPNGRVGAADIKLEAGSGPPPLPLVTSISPMSGSTAGGTRVTISGSNLSGVSAVKFGSASASSFKALSATSVEAASPAGSGVVDVTVTTGGGTSPAGEKDRFTYVAPPTVTALNPSLGYTIGGTPVTITGTNLSAVGAVRFGANAAKSFRVVSSSQIEAVSPAGPAGTVDVTVTAPGGTSGTSEKDRFLYYYQPPPATSGTVYVSLHDLFGGYEGPSSGVTGAAAWTYTTCTYNGWSGRQTVMSNGAWLNEFDSSEAWAKGVTSTTSTLWWMAGTGVLQANTRYALYADIDTCNAGTPKATYTIAGNDGQAGFPAGDTQQQTKVVDQATTNGYAYLGMVDTGNAGVTVGLVNGAGASATVGAADIEMVPAPWISSLSPSSGEAGGGTKVTISGGNLAGATAVYFGSVKATIVSDSASAITVISPAGSAGTVNVSVSTGQGTSTQTPAYFTYLSSAPTHPHGLFIGLSDRYASSGGPAVALTGETGLWHQTTCTAGGWMGATETLEAGTGLWTSLSSSAEWWVYGKANPSTTTLWWTAGTGVLVPEAEYKIWVDVDTCNAGTSAAYYTIAGEDGEDSFARASGTQTVKVDQETSGGYVYLGSEWTGASRGITIATANGGANGQLGAADIKLERTSTVCRKKPCAE